MFASLGRYVLLAVRFVLVAAGLGLFALAAYAIVSIPPEPPGGDGFVTGGAYLLWGALSILSLGLAGLGVALPTFHGADDLLGFDRSQRRLLQIGGAFFLGALLVGAVGVSANSFAGILLSLLLVLLGVFGVCSALAWRFGEVVRDGLTGAVESDDS